MGKPSTEEVNLSGTGQPVDCYWTILWRDPLNQAPKGAKYRLHHNSWPKLSGKRTEGWMDCTWACLHPIASGRSLDTYGRSSFSSLIVVLGRMHHQLTGARRYR